MYFSCRNIHYVLFPNHTMDTSEVKHTRVFSCTVSLNQKFEELVAKKKSTILGVSLFMV